MSPSVKRRPDYEALYEKDAASAHAYTLDSAMNLSAIQAALRSMSLDAWLFYDHHHRDTIAYRVLGLAESLHVTRRWYYLIPAQGEPQKLVHRIESHHLDSLPGSYHEYSTWQEQHSALREITSAHKRIAMQYSPNNAIPYIGLVDAGTVELIRSFGREIVGSGDLVSQFEAVWTPEQIRSHYAARDAVDRVMAATFAEIGRRVRDGGTNEYEIAEWVREAFRRENMTDELPIVGVNAHAADPHYAPSPEKALPIRQGDFVLLDMWGRVLGSSDNTYYDITWTGVVGAPTDKHEELFRITRDARTAACERVRQAFALNERIAGWQVDDAARDVIRNAGYGDRFVHRTGHSIGSIDIHGNGANMDNLETHDDRTILPNSCFSIEPGIYLTDYFGVRSEVNVLIENGQAVITGAQQSELVRI
ncbi:MAG: M24 family metallopeptidase [Acidobacteriaceae bacterium]